MRCLHLYSGNLYGGIETLLVTLARYRHLSPDMDPHFALCFEGRLSDELSASGAGVYNLGPVRVSRPWSVRNARRRLHEVFTRHQIDVVVCHSCWPHAIFASVVRACRVPLVFWAHNRHTGKHWLERWSRLNPPDLVVANSRFTQAGVTNLFRGVVSEVLYLPVAAPELADRATTRRLVRAELKTPEDATVIILASRLEAWKGHLLLLESLSRLTDLDNWICWIAGGPQRPMELAYQNELKARARKLGIHNRVRFLGQRSDVSRLFAASDIHCQPNTGPEPFGIVFIEALYASLPIVATELGGVLEIVNQKCGILVTPNDELGLSRELGRLICDSQLRRQLGSRGPQRARELCDPANQMGRLNAIFQQLANSQHDQAPNAAA